MYKTVLVALFLCCLALIPNVSEAACSGSGITWSCTAGTTQAQVNTAISSATDGATFTFASGAYSWGSTTIELPNAKGITLQGAGAGNSIVTVTGNTIIGMSGTLSGNNTKTYRITGFTFQNAPSSLVIWFFGPGTLNNLRIDHNTFTNFATSSIAIHLGEVDTSAKFFGVIDHNTFSGTVNFMGLKILGTGTPNAWASTVRGTSNNMFLEDNIYDFDSATDLGSGCIDLWSSAVVVFRYNTTRNCLVTAHGSYGGGGALNFEIYHNTLQRSGGDSMWQDGTRLIHHQGSGETFIWANTFLHSVNPIAGDAITITHYRSTTPADGGYNSPPNYRCDGTQPVDGNFSPGGTYYGYPCWVQPGRAPAGGSPVYGTLAPGYSWQNVDNATGNIVSMVIGDPFSEPGSPFVADHVKMNRDLYDAVSNTAQTSATSPFNGTTGMGFGTLANRPTTCTTGGVLTEAGLGGVGYFATDQGAQGVLYRCSATNTWTVHYTPYTYPHPLVSGGATLTLSAPANLRVLP